MITKEGTQDIIDVLDVLRDNGLCLVKTRIIKDYVKPLTEQEVCEALDKYLKSVFGKNIHVHYEVENKCFTYILFKTADDFYEKDFVKLLGGA